MGAGGAGYAAALTAAEAGKNVVLLEKLGIVGGDTILSGGAMAVPNNWFQKRDGIEDSVEKMAEDMIVGGDHVGDPDLVNVICEGAYGAMQYIQTYPTCDTQTGALLYVGNMRLENRAICINKEGDRFVEEMERRDVISNAIKEQTDGIGYMIFNQDGLDHTDIATVNAAEMDGLFGRGQLAKGETIAEACEPFGIDAAELQKTVEKWNGYCKDGADPDFNYRAALNPIEGGPYYILAYKPSVHYTMGGLHINTDAQVLDSDGAPIPGLFAAGEQAGHKMGTNRLGSCSITDVFVFGRVAGANAAALA